MEMEAVRGGVTAPTGFLAAGVACGIKKRGRDLSLIFSQRPAVAAGLLTTHPLRAPCVDRAARLIRQGVARAIVANSGSANCCTGRRGREDCAEMARQAGRHLGIPASQVFVASTGVIGRFLPMQRVASGIRRASHSLSRTGSTLAAEGIMTTDTRPKEIAIRFRWGGEPVTVAGIAKGAGMVAPHLATMLAFLTTDARIERGLLAQILKLWVARTFNRITIDGDPSTNDMVLALANGASPAPAIRRGSPGHQRFQDALGAVCRTLAHELVRDGEGVTRLFTVRVWGAESDSAAQRLARGVADSPLVRTMVAGRDPNWGRIAAAAGAAGVPIQPGRLTIRLGRRTVFHRGEPVRVSRQQLLEQVDHPEVQFGIQVGRGPGEATVLSADLTEEYVRINAKYTS